MNKLGVGAALVAFAAYYNTLNAGFVYDDTRAILQNDDLLAKSSLSNLFTNDFWGTPLSHSGSHKSYRPLCSLTFKLNALWSGLTPYTFHLVNVLLHSLATYLFVAFAKTTLRSRLGLWMSSLLFALHPIHTEAVAGVVGRADVLSAIFFLLALLAFKKHQKEVKSGEKYLAITLLSATCAMFSKEQGVTVLGVCCVLDCLKRLKSKKGQSMKKWPLACLVISIAALLSLRGRLMGFQPPKFAKADNPASASDSLLARSLTLAFLPAFNFWLMLCPTQLSFDWSMDAIPLITSWSDPRNVLSAVFYAGLLALAYRTRKVPSMTTSLAVMVLSFLPATNLFFYVGFVVAERVLYIPSIGLCLILGHGMTKISSILCRRKMTTICGATLLLACFALQTLKRNQDWKDEESLYKAGIPINPAKALGNLGNVLTQKGRLTEAENAFKQALNYRSNMADTHYNLGVLLQRQNRLDESLEWYKNAIRFRPKLVLAHLNLALTYSSLGKKEKALKILLDIQSIDDDGLKDPKTHLTTQVTALYHAGKLCLELGRPLEAVSLLRKAESSAKAVNYEAQGILNVLGEAFQALNKTTEAELFYQAALKAKPDHIPAYLTYGKLLAKNKTRHSEAESWFSKAKYMAPEDPSVHLHYGLFLMDSERNLEAAKEFAKASELKPDDYESVFNAGVAFRQAGKNSEAETFYRKAVDLKPNDPSAHMNLGAMLHLIGKLSEAEDHYLTALRLRPHDQATAINIQRLHRVMTAKGMPIRHATVN